METDMEYIPSPLNHHHPLKGQQAYRIVNVCAFVNTIQKMDKKMDMKTPLSTTTAPSTSNKSMPSKYLYL